MKQYLIYGGIAVVIFGAGFGAARFTTPTKVVTVDKVVTTDHQLQTVHQDVDMAALKQMLQDVTQDIAKQMDRKNNVRRDTTTEVKPDGSKLTHTVITDQTETTAKTDAHTDTQTAATGTLKLTSKFDSTDQHDSSTTTEHSTTMEYQLHADWAFGVNVGYYIPSLAGRSLDFNLSPVRGLVGGIQIERHLLWGFWGGAWGNTAGMAGLSLKLEF